jgi:hypothetical protein
MNENEQKSLENIVAAFEKEIRKHEADKRMGFKASPSCLEDSLNEFLEQWFCKKCKCCGKIVNENDFEHDEDLDMRGCLDCLSDAREAGKYHPDGTLKV